MNKVIVTGASGFIGSQVADELSNRGYEVVLFDVKESPYKRPNQQMVVGNLSDRELLSKITKDVDCVYHFAGVADIDLANKNPYETISTNILGTTNLIEACLRNDVKRFMFASSVYVHSVLGGFYTATKKACENIIENYAKTSGLNYTILRYGSLYGARAGENNGIYRIIKGIIENDSFTYWGTGEEMREFINIIDAARISVKCLDDEFKNRTLVLTGTEKFRIKDLIVMVKEILGKEVKVCFEENPQSLHYNITPYNYAPKLGEKITNNPRIDMGQGILELIKEMKNDISFAYIAQ
jgi:UDP-glucose 4-epimerase